MIGPEGGVRRAEKFDSPASQADLEAARYALVERNGEPVERTHYGNTALEDGDTLVVARPVAGG